jgi:hypothetical protein
MISMQETVAFVWRCPDCAAVYEGESLFFLHADGEHRYCSCGGLLEEGVEPTTEHHYRLVLPEYLRGTRLHRQLERRLAGDECVEVSTGRGERYIHFDCAN